MTTCTPLGLPVVEGSDRPCDFDDYSCAFAAAVEAQLDALDDLVTRTATSPPMAWIETVEPVLVPVGTGDTQIIFDTVIADTADMVDLTGLSGITLTREGIYMVGFYLEGVTNQPGGILTATSDVTALAPFSLFTSSILPTMDTIILTSPGLVAHSQFAILELMAGDAFVLRCDANGFTGDSFTTRKADLWAVWLGDLA